MPTDIWGWLKFLGPYLLEILRVLFGGPHSIAMDNLKEKGIIKDK